MSNNKTAIPKGTRDFSADEIANRNYIFDTIRQVFENHGFRPIETPAMENLSTLLGKYGDEGDKLLFKILNSGDFIDNIPSSEFVSHNVSALSNKICEKGLRYDLTVPFARYVVQHRDEIVFPFRRYQIQPVWRADRPQKGRYREFYQCDADIIGSNSLLNEYELIQILDEAYIRLNLPVTIKINNRKILSGIAEVIGYPQKIIDITIAIDKLDKIGVENVKIELANSGISLEAIQKLEPIFGTSRLSMGEKLQLISNWLDKSEIGKQGIEEMNTLLSYIQSDNLSNTVDFDITLARGLNYYTGTIFEVKANNMEVGSISGGGRYDNLTGIFGVEGISGVGISFGADRIYDVLSQLNAFPQSNNTITQILFINFNFQSATYLLPYLKILRSRNIPVELYPDVVRLKKQLAYADAKKIPFVAIAGEEEIANNKILLKSMANGEQKSFDKEDFVSYVLKILSR
jgi:histidyl-tRNA synthetase